MTIQKTLTSVCVVALAAACGGESSVPPSEEMEPATPGDTGVDVDSEDPTGDDDTVESACSDSTSSASGLVTTSMGDIQGIEGDDGVWQFLGIPFAQPPVGDLRWQPPAEPGCFEQQPFVANALGPECPQLQEGEVVGDEDCLQLNVWTPADYRPDSKLPVLFFIHGGANVLGSASMGTGGRPLADGTVFANQEDVVVVSIQYRLGPFGFLSLPELTAESNNDSSGNYAYLDMIAALNWVQENIEGFGGDPERVMVFGQSAGAINVCTLLASPLAHGLFSSALMQSGGCVASPIAQSQAQHDTGVAVFDECHDAADRLACLRSLSVDRIIATIPGSIDSALGEAGEDGAGMAYGAVIDEYLLPDSPLALIARGEHNDVPFVLGSTADEMASDNIFTFNVETVEEYEAFIATYFAEEGEEIVAAILELYPAQDYETPQEALIQVFTDRSFTSSARLIARAAASASTSPVYRYVFSKNTGTPMGMLPARHGIDLLYVFNTLSRIPLIGSDPSDAIIADAMMASWAAFARGGDPKVSQSGVSWEPYDVQRDNYLDFGEALSTGDGFRTEKCNLWDSLQEL